MRFVVLVKANKDSEAGVLPTRALLAEMGKFNDELVKAGVMLAGGGDRTEQEAREEMPMRFMKFGRPRERGAPRPQALSEKFGKRGEKGAKKGVFVGGGGLGPRARGPRARLSNGKITVTDGPF